MSLYYRSLISIEIPFRSVDYRLRDDQLRGIISMLQPAISDIRDSNE